MKKTLYLIYVLFLMFGLSACGTSNGDNVDIGKQETPIIKGEESKIKEQVIYEDKQIKVTIYDSDVGFVDNMTSFVLPLKIQNKTSHELVVVVDSVLINDIVLTNYNLLNETIKAKSTNEVSWIFEDYMYTRHGFGTIASISFDLIKYETINNNYKVSRTDLIRIESDHKDYVHTINGEGKVLVDEKGYKIVAQEAELFTDGEKEYYCWFYVENMSGIDAAFQIKKVSVNGYVVKNSSHPRFIVPTNSKGYISLVFTEDDIENYKLNPIDRIYVEVAVVEDLDAHSYGEEIIKNQSFGVYYNSGD